MEALTSVGRGLGLHRSRWERVGPQSIWSAGLATTGAWTLFAFARFGGSVVEGPRSFLRLPLVGLWAWIALAIAMWLLAAVLGGQNDTIPDPVRAVAAVGLGHSPLVGLGLVVFVSAGLFDVLGPATAMGWFTLAIWFPATLMGIARAVLDLTWARSMVVVGVPYLVWYLTAARHLLDQIGHLL